MRIEFHTKYIIEQLISNLKKGWKHTPSTLDIYFGHLMKCFLNEYLLSCNEAQEPRGEEAVVDDERHLRLYKPPGSQFLESSFSPFRMTVNCRFPLLHPYPALFKGTQKADQHDQQSF